MGNLIFASAVSALKNVENEIARVESHHGEVQVAVQSVQTRLDVLKKNEQELNDSNNAMAAKVAEGRKLVEEAQKQAAQIIADGHAQATNIVASAQERDRKMLEETQRKHDETIKSEAARSATVESELKSAHAELADVNARLINAKNELNNLKTAALEFSKK